MINSFKYLRYIRERKRLQFTTDLRDRVIDSYPVERFKEMLRLTPSQFEDLVDLIRENPCMRSGNSIPPREVIRIKLKVALFRLGTRGISEAKVASIFGISDGSVSAYTWQCIYAIEDLMPQFVVWPNEVQKAAIKTHFKNVHGFPNCIGSVDGVCFPLFAAPSWEPQAFNTRKCVHAVSAIGVCDHLGRFIFFSAGHLGSTHDSLALRRTPMYKWPSFFFRGPEYLIADAAFALTLTVIPRIRNPNNEEARFNSYLGQARVVIEHAFGMLKNKFQSLQNLPIKIEKKEDIDKTSSWILACVVLHNFIRQHAEHEITDDEVLDQPLEDDIFVGQPGRPETPGIADDIAVIELSERAAGQRDLADAKKRRNKLVRWVMQNRNRITRWN